MNNLKFINLIMIALLLNSCGAVKSGFVNPKKDNSDEFLVEKKMPLKIPPAFNELPQPGKDNQNNKASNNEIKSLIKKNENNKSNQLEKQKVGKNIKEALLEKIKKN